MKCKFLLLMCATAMLASCVDPKIDDAMNIDGSVPSQSLALKPQMVFNAEQAIAGEIIVKFRESAAETIESATTLLTEGQVVTGVESIDAFCKTVGAYNMERLFPNAGRFEARQRKAGLHLWYKISFDEGVSMSKVGEMLSNNKDLEVVEYSVSVELPKEAKTVDATAEVAEQQLLASDDLPFNDPMLVEQWHYQNRGTDWTKADGTPYMDLSVAGADVNVVPAWAKCTGSNNVIVAIIDTPLDFDHDDLAANVWWNEAEKNGSTGVDDDGNGYVDDLFGYSFYHNSGGYLASGSHGTHVAGTVGAVNNNGKGVSGIAGGSGVGDGVRLMSLGIFSEYGEGKGSSCSAPAITYACNNGAVICQNSWSFGEPNSVDHQYSSLQAAIKYFIDYAGTDETGEVQVGPMKGGLVVFAAGNDGYVYGDQKFYPAAEDNVVAVAAMAADYRPSWFTSYGKWVDITAPGGDAIFVDSGGNCSYGNILSTESGNTYSYKYGTSMACPHVSGVAALAVSYADQMGLKIESEDLKQYIYDTARDIESYLKDDDYKGISSGGKSYVMYMKDYRGKMGAGLIDAEALLKKLDGEVKLPDDHVAPEAAESFTQTVKGINHASIEWKITGDYTGAPVNSYRLYWSLGEITVTDKGAVTATKTLYGPVVVAVGGRQIGDALSGQMTKMAPSSEYNVALVSVDKWNKTSLGCNGTVMTDDPVAPEAVSDLKITASTYTSLTIGFTGVADCVGENIAQYRIRYSTSSSMANAKNETVSLAAGSYGTLKLENLQNDMTYYIEVVAIDQYGLESEAAKVSGKTPKNYAPTLVAVGETTKTLQYWDKASVEFEANEPNGDKWTAKIVGTVDSYIKMDVAGNKITVTFTGNSQSLSARTYAAKVVVTDESGLKSAEVPFTFNIIGNEAPVAKQIPDVYMGATGQKHTIALADYFTDGNGETLNYDVAISSSTAVARVEGGNLVVEGSKYGLVTVTVTGRDAGNKTAESKFKVMVRDDSKPVELYPNPVVKDLNIRMGQSVKGTVGVRLFSAAGPMAMETTASIDPFDPAKVDLSQLGAGNYVVEVSYGGETYKSTIVKK